MGIFSIFACFFTRYIRKKTFQLDFTYPFLEVEIDIAVQISIVQIVHEKRNQCKNGKKVRHIDILLLVNTVFAYNYTFPVK